MALFIKLGWYFRLQWRRYMAAILMLIGVDLLEMTIPWITGRVIDHVVEGTLTSLILWRFVATLVAIAINGSHHSFNVAMMSVDGEAHDARASISHCA